MSTTAVRMTTHAPSPSYVPRSTLSRPNSPALPPKPQTSNQSNHHGHVRSSSTSRLESPSNLTKATMMSPSLGNAPTPRLGPMERSSSGLRNEVISGEKEKKERSEAAQAILKILSSLPAPLPETLPSTFLPTPNASPKSTTSSSSSRTFGEYARSSTKRNKRKRPTDSSSSSCSSSDEPSSSGSGNSTKNSGIGLGLGLTMSSEKGRKKIKTNQYDLTRTSLSVGQNGRSLTPAGQPNSSSALLSKKLGKSALRNQLGDQQKEEGKETWSKDKWFQMAQVYKERALLLKRRGDAYSGAPSAHPQFKAKLPADPLKGVLSHTDAVLLWLYAYFCDEQGSGRVRSTPYSDSAPLRDFVRRTWETEMRKAPEEEEGRREMAQAMVGLMHLIEAVVCYHLTSEQLAHLNKRGRELAISTTPPGHGPSPRSTTSASPPGSATLAHPSSSQPQPHPSPAGRSTSSSSGSHHSPESHITTTSYNLPNDLLPLINSSTTSSIRASQHLLTSRHHLTLKNLRTYFPKTFENAITSELNDEALPIPGDNLGSARKIDIDLYPENFAWPIELGMCAPIAHTVAFGRCLVEEMAGFLGKDWNRVQE